MNLGRSLNAHPPLAASNWLSLSRLLPFEGRRLAGPSEIHACAVVLSARSRPLRFRSPSPWASGGKFVHVSCCSPSLVRAASAWASLRPRRLGPPPFGSLSAPLRSGCLGVSAPSHSSAARPCLLAVLAARASPPAAPLRAWLARFPPVRVARVSIGSYVLALRLAPLIDFQFATLSKTLFGVVLGSLTTCVVL